MPKRTNPFQKLVYTIYRQLAPDASVTQSKELPDLVTGKKREVDIVIEKVVANSLLVIGVECASRSRRADITWVEQLAKKHERLPTDHLILVAEAGFAADAITLAQQLNIETLTLDEATDADWTEIVGKLTHLYIARYTTETVACHAELARKYKQSINPAVGGDQVLYSSEGQSLGTLAEISKMITQPHMKDVIGQISEDGEQTLLIGYRCPDRSYLIDSQGNNTEVVALHFALRVIRDRTTPIELKHNAFKSAKVAHGVFDGEFGKGTLTIIEQEGKPWGGEMTVHLNPDATGTSATE